MIDPSTDRHGTWRSRALRFRLAHHRNVLQAFIRGDVSARSCWVGLRYPAHIVTVPFKSPKRGSLWVCPEVLDILEQIDTEMQLADSGVQDALGVPGDGSMA